MKRLLAATSLLLLAACGQQASQDSASQEMAPLAEEVEQTSEPAAGTGATDWPPVKPEGALRVATFNVSFYREEQGQLLEDLMAGGDPQIEAVAEIIRRVDPDVLVLNEIDWDNNDRPLGVFRDNYLDPAPVDGKKALSYPFIYSPDVNTGVPSGVDLDNDGQAVTQPGTRGYGNDAFGYGTYEGQYGMAILSKKRIFMPRTRTFQTFLWKDMPDNAMPTDYYSAEAQEVFRLPSKTMVDVSFLYEDQPVHIIVAHTTPPAFDGPENRNGRRNHDEIRLIADYVTPGAGDYVYDDKGQTGGIAEGEPFIIFGDLNADPNEGDSYNNAISLLLDNPLVLDPAPSSEGAVAAAARQGGVNAGHVTPARLDTADFSDANENSVGNLRIDYVLPSRQDFQVVGSGVFWPTPDQPGFELVGEGWPVISSDHRLVWVDLRLKQQEE